MYTVNYWLDKETQMTKFSSLAEFGESVKDFAVNGVSFRLDFPLLIGKIVAVKVN